MKKIIALFLATFLMVGCIGLTASAAETVTVSLLGANQAIVSEEYEVVLNIDEITADAIGGISGTVTYDSEKFELNRVEISETFAAANYITDNAADTINTETTGKINLALLDVKNDDAKNDWITFVFTVKDSVGSATFNIENVVLSDATGTSTVTNSLAVEVTDNVYAHMIDVNGASIRKDGTGNIRFETELDADVLDAIKNDSAEIAEVGVLIIPTIYVDNGELTLNADGENVYASATYGNKSIAKVSVSYDVLKANSEIFSGKVYGYLSNTIKYKVSTSFTARAYVLTTEGQYIYSDNKIVANGIVGGASSKSCIETAKAIITANNVTFEDATVQAIVDKAEWTNDEYVTVVKALAEVVS